MVFFKEIVVFRDADLEKLFDEWEENDEDELEEDEKPEHKRKPPQMDLDSLKAKVRIFKRKVEKNEFSRLKTRKTCWWWRKKAKPWCFSSES